MGRKRKADQAGLELEPDYTALAKLSDEDLLELGFKCAELRNAIASMREGVRLEQKRAAGKIAEIERELASASQKLLDAREARKQRPLEFEAQVTTGQAAETLAQVARVADGDAPLPSLDGPEPEELRTDPTECSACRSAVKTAAAPGVYMCSNPSCDWVGCVVPEDPTDPSPYDFGADEPATQADQGEQAAPAAEPAEEPAEQEQPEAARVLPMRGRRKPKTRAEVAAAESAGASA